tara:strand:+ start:11900 stop:12442 length:543 start_codon:yes stop_codon:yes gene_type:complete
MANNQDSHTWDKFGPKFIINVNDPEPDNFGGESFSLKGTNDNQTNFLISHHENDQSRIHAEGGLLIEAGVKKEANHSGPLIIEAWGGDLDLNSAQDDVRIKAAGTITLDATHIVLKAKESIQLGSQSVPARDMTLNATRIHVEGKLGNLPFALGIGYGAMIAFGPGAFVGAAVAKKFFGR